MTQNGTLVLARVRGSGSTEGPAPFAAWGTRDLRSRGIHVRPPTPLELAVRMGNARDRIAGYRLAANELLDRAEALEAELADDEEVLEAMRDADRELERPWTRRRGRVV